MTFTGNFVGTAGRYLGQDASVKLIDGGIAVVAPPGPWGVMAAYSVATGAQIWARNGAEGSDDLIRQYQPLLVSDGKLLVRVLTRSHEECSYTMLGADEIVSSSGIGYVSTVEYPGLHQMFPVSATYHEVIELSSGATLAQRSLDAGELEFDVPVPTGTATLSVYPDYDGGGPYEPPYPTFLTGSAKTEYQSLSSSPNSPWRKASGVWATLNINPEVEAGVGWHFLNFFTDPDPPYYKTHQQILQPMRQVACSLPIPPPHSPTECCVSTDGAVIVFGPNTTPYENLKYRAIVDDVPTDLPWGAPHTADHVQYCVGLDWDLEELWSVEIPALGSSARPIAQGDNVLLSFGVEVASELFTRYRLLDPATGETVTDYDLPYGLDNSSRLITSETRLVGIGNYEATIINVSPPPPTP